VEFPFLNSSSQIFQLFHPFKGYYLSLCFHFVLHSHLHTSTQMCRYFLYSFTSPSFYKVCPPGPRPLQTRNRILFLINKYVRLKHDVAASRTVRLAHGRYRHGTGPLRAVESLEKSIYMQLTLGLPPSWWGGEGRKGASVKQISRLFGARFLAYSLAYRCEVRTPNNRT
jgi:hypothetical protein